MSQKVGDRQDLACQAPLPAVQEVVALNLANQHGSEGVLSSAFKEEADRFGKSHSGLRLVPFDFHKECGATRYDRCA